MGAVLVKASGTRLSKEISHAACISSISLTLFQNSRQPIADFPCPSACKAGMLLSRQHWSRIQDSCVWISAMPPACSENQWLALCLGFPIHEVQRMTLMSSVSISTSRSTAEECSTKVMLLLTQETFSSVNCKSSI